MFLRIGAVWDVIARLFLPRQRAIRRGYMVLEALPRTDSRPRPRRKACCLDRCTVRHICYEELVGRWGRRGCWVNEVFHYLAAISLSIAECKMIVEMYYIICHFGRQAQVQLENAQNR